MIFPALYTPVARRSRSNPSCGSTPTSTNMTPKVRVEVAASPASAAAFPGRANAPSPVSSGTPASRMRSPMGRTGRRGYVLTLTAAGRQHLDVAARAVRDRLAERLADWDDRDVAAFAQLVTRFN